MTERRFEQLRRRMDKPKHEPATTEYPFQGHESELPRVDDESADEEIRMDPAVLGFSTLPGLRKWTSEQDGRKTQINVVSLADLSGDDQNRPEDYTTINMSEVTESGLAYDPSERATYFL